MYYYGKNTIKGMIESKKLFEEIYISGNFRDYNFLSFLKNNKLKYITISEKKINVLADNNNHQGVVAKGFEYQYSNIESILSDTKDNENSLVLILDGLEDPQNLGSIIRTGEALQINGILIPKNRSVRVTPTVAKVSTGALENVKIAQVTNLKQEIKKLKDAGFWIVGADMNTNVNYDQLDYKMKIALVIGSEGKGISTSVLSNCDFIVKIPMYGQVSSLNAAVSAAIIMYQINSSRFK